MAQLQQTPLQVKPQANIYTVLVIVALLVLSFTVGVVIWSLTTAYGLDFTDIFKSALPG